MLRFSSSQLSRAIPIDAWPGQQHQALRTWSADYVPMIKEDARHNNHADRLRDAGEHQYGRPDIPGRHLCSAALRSLRGLRSKRVPVDMKRRSLFSVPRRCFPPCAGQVRSKCANIMPPNALPIVASRMARHRPSACDDCRVADAPFGIRPARDEDRLPLAVLFAAVAEERSGIAAEPPVDVDALATDQSLDGALAAAAGDDIIGWLHVEKTPFGFGEIGMLVASEWRRRGVGSALLEAAIERARERGMYKLSLSVFAHNTAAIALYHKFGLLL